MADQTTTTFNNSFATELGTQSWSLFGVGALIYCLRMWVEDILSCNAGTDNGAGSHGYDTMAGVG